MLNQSPEVEKRIQSPRQFARGNLSPLKQGITKQLVGLRKNVEKLVISDSLAGSKVVGALMVKHSQ
jgi:hypothetical protein